MHASNDGVFQTEYSVSAPGVMSPQCGAVLHVPHGSGLSPLLPLCVVCTFVLALQQCKVNSLVNMLQWCLLMSLCDLRDYKYLNSTLPHKMSPCIVVSFP